MMMMRMKEREDARVRNIEIGIEESRWRWG